MVLKDYIDFVKYIVAEIRYQIIYYALGGIAQFEDFIFAWSNKSELVDKSGEIAVITGGSRGIGTHVVRMLLQCNMHVVIGCRNTKAGEDLVAGLRTAGVRTGSAECISLDTGSLRSVQKFAQTVSKKYPKINVLINNAGIMFVPYSETVDGIESHQAVNYVGHFLLTQELLPCLEAAGKNNPRGTKSRIVNVTSCAHIAGSINYKDFNNKKLYIASAAYAQSKLAQLISTVHMARMFVRNSTPINVYAVHPGIVNTEIFDGTGIKTIFPWVPKLLFKAPEKGAIPVVHAAISPVLEKRTGVYISNCRESTCKKSALDPARGERLHQFTLDLIRESLSK